MTSVLDEMRHIKWGMKEMIQAYLMEPAEEAKYTSVKMHRERFIEVLLEKEEILKIVQDEILKDEVLKQLGFVRVERLRQELEILQIQSVYFGAYKDEASLQAFDIKAVEELKTHAPNLFETLID
jgi:hypothetical protein